MRIFLYDIQFFVNMHIIILCYFRYKTEKEIYNVLEALSQVRRIDMLVMFLGNNHKQGNVIFSSNAFFFHFNIHIYMYIKIHYINVYIHIYIIFVSTYCIYVKSPHTKKKTNHIFLTHA